MQVKQRLNALISMLGITKSEFAKAIKVSPGNVSDWFNKENSNPGQAALKRICEVYNVNLNWLLTGEGPRQNWDMNSALKRLGLEPVPLDEPEPARIIRLPIVGEIAAGTPLSIPDIEPVAYIPVDTAILPNAARCLAFRVSGDSMSPDIIHSDVVIICQDYDWEKLDKRIVAAQINGENTLKTLHLDHKHRQFILYPINNRHHNPLIYNEDDQDSVQILGSLVFLIRTYA
jgi:SOS-response transcriptional repressor LexA